MVDSVDQRIKMLREKWGLTQTELAERLGVGQSAVAQMEQGRHKPSFDVLEAFVRQLGANPLYLLTGQGEPLLGSPLIASAQGPTTAAHKALPPATGPTPAPAAEPWGLSAPMPHAAQAPHPNVVLVPVPAQAGYRYLNAETAVPTDECERLYLPLLGRGDFYGFEISGDSMEPGLRAGDYVFGRPLPQPDALLSKHLYTLLYGSRLVTKRIQKLGGHHLRLLSDNPYYEPEDIQLSDLRGIWTVERVFSRHLASPHSPLVEALQRRVESLELLMQQMQAARQRGRTA